MPENNNALGFSLLELMITLCISAILLSITYPNYLHYQTRAKRIQAEVNLMRLSARLEDYFSNNNTYLGADENNMGISQLNRDSNYQFVLADMSDQHYLIEAIPNNNQAKHDPKCGMLSVTDTNEKMISGSGKRSDCWQEK